MGDQRIPTVTGSIEVHLRRLLDTAVFVPLDIRIDTVSEKFLGADLLPDEGLVTSLSCGSSLV